MPHMAYSSISLFMYILYVYIYGVLPKHWFTEDHEYPQKAPNIVMIDHYFPSVTGFGQDIISYKKTLKTVYSIYIYIHIYTYIVYIIHEKIYTPWKKSTWNMSSWRFGDDYFPLQNWYLFRFQPLIFRGVWGMTAATPLVAPPSLPQYIRKQAPGGSPKHRLEITGGSQVWGEKDVGHLSQRLNVWRIYLHFG